MVQAQKERSEFTLTSGPSHERQVHVCVGESKSVAQPLLLEFDTTAMKNRFVDLASVLLLENATDREQRRRLATTEPLIEILTEEPCDYWCIRIQFDEWRRPTLGQQ